MKKEDNFGARIKIICNFVAERVTIFLLKADATLNKT